MIVRLLRLSVFAVSAAAAPGIRPSPGTSRVH